MKNPKVSIIIPVYNAEKTLSYCLNSILEQTYKNFEIILINDGSVDKSLKIISEYKSKHPEVIRTFSQRNLGVATARNNGIKYAKGKYLFFIDNDDYIEKDYIELFTKEIEKTKVDLVIGGFKRVSTEGKVIYKRIPQNTEWSKYMFLTPWARIYKRKALIDNDIKFLKMNIGEDVYINILSYIKLKVSIFDYVGYNWVNNRTSVSNTLHKGFNKKVEIIEMLEAIHNVTEKNALPEKKQTLIEYFFTKTCIFYILYSGKGVEFKNLKEGSEHIFSWLSTHYPNYKANRYISPFAPKGEALSTRVVVWVFLLLQKLSLENAFLWIYSKL